MRFKKLYESKIAKNLIVVDIQPAYKKFFSNSLLNSFISYLNKNEFKKIIYLFNGPDLGYEDWGTIQNWLIENGLSEDVYIDEHFEKNYAFFRDVMDTGLMNDDEIIELARYMIKTRIWDIRDIKNWDKINISQDTKEDLQTENYGFYIPDVAFLLKKLSGSSILIGGEENSCLEEVRLLLEILKKSYKKERKYIF